MRCMTYPPVCPFIEDLRWEGDQVVIRQMKGFLHEEFLLLPVGVANIYLLKVDLLGFKDTLDMVLLSSHLDQ